MGKLIDTIVKLTGIVILLVLLLSFTFFCIGAAHELGIRLANYIFSGV